MLKNFRKRKAKNNKTSISFTQATIYTVFALYLNYLYNIYIVLGIISNLEMI